MRRVIFLLVAALRSGQAWNDPRGHSSCPCVIPDQTLWCDGSNRAMHNGSCYPKSYGAAMCADHDINLTTECESTQLPCKTVDGSLTNCASFPNRWCGGNWCWINPAECSLPHRKSSFFPGVQLHYSYETCGNLNEYNPNRYEDILRSVRNLRISFPGSSGSGYTVVTDQGYSGLDVNNGTNRKFGDFGRVGSTVEFFDRIWKEYTYINYTVVRVSEASERRYPQSSFTACIHELALNTTDACVGNFWTTLERQLLAPFTGTIYEDTFHVVVFHKEQGQNFWKQIFSTFELFTWTEWLMLFGFLSYAAVIMWLMEGSSNEQEFPHKSGADGLLRSLFTHIQCFVGLGDFRYSPHTNSARIVTLMVSFAMMIAVTHFTESMIVAEIGEMKQQGSYESLGDLLKDEAKVCGLESNKMGFALQNPGALPLYVSVGNARKGLSAMDKGYCKGAILTKDEWELEKNTNCNKSMLPATLFSKANAYGMRSDLAAPFTWAMTKFQEQGVYSHLAARNREIFTASGEDSCVGKVNGDEEEKSDKPSILESKMLGPVILAAGIITATFAIYVTNDARRRKDDTIQVPSLRDRFCPSGTQMARRRSLVADMEHIRAESRDLKMVAKVFEARHETEMRLQNKLKGDSPLTVSDVPMLVHLLTTSARQQDGDYPMHSLSLASSSESRAAIGDSTIHVDM